MENQQHDYIDWWKYCHQVGRASTMPDKETSLFKVEKLPPGGHQLSWTREHHTEKWKYYHQMAKASTIPDEGTSH